MIRLLRFLLRIPSPRLSKIDAVKIAREKCREEGWQWREPIVVNEGLREYHIMTNAGRRGSNVNVRVNAASGEVVFAALAPR